MKKRKPIILIALSGLIAGVIFLNYSFNQIDTALPQTVIISNELTSIENTSVAPETKNNFPFEKDLKENSDVAIKTLEPDSELLESIAKYRNFKNVFNSLFNAIYEEEDAINILAEFSTECINHPRSQTELEEELSSLDEINALDEDVRAGLKSKFEFCSNMSDEDYLVTFAGLKDSAERGNLRSQLLLFHMPIPRKLQKNEELMQNLNLKKFEQLQQAFKQGSVEAALMLAAENMFNGNNIEAHLYARVANKYYPNNDTERLVKNTSLLLSNPEILEVEEIFTEKELEFLSSKTIYLVKKD